MFQSLQNVVMKPFRRYNSQENTQNPSPYTAPDRDDRLDDGYLLVGDTASERTTIRASDFRSDRVDPPPCYNQLNRNGDLPSYTDYNSNRSMFSPTLDVSNNSRPHQPNSLTTASPTIQKPSTNHSQSNPRTELREQQKALAVCPSCNSVHNIAIQRSR